MAYAGDVIFVDCADAECSASTSLVQIGDYGSSSVGPKLDIACKVTLRGEVAEEVLKKLLVAVDNIIPETKFDDSGNFSFGIAEYLDIPGIEYNVEIGIIGLEAAVTLSRPGFRVKRRNIRPTKIPKSHKIKREEAMKFMGEKYGVKFEEDEEE